MALVAKQSGESRKPVPAGNYFGVCVGVYDLGTQSGGQYGPKHQVVLQWELHKKKGVCRNDDGKPMLMSGFYNLAFGEDSNLRKHVEAILGRKFTEAEAKDGYDVTQLVDQACRMTVVHEERDGGGMKDKISAFMPLDEDDPKIEPQSDSVVYELDVTRPVADDVPEWVKRKVHESQEWVAKHGAPPASKGKGKATATVGKGKAAAGGDDDDDDDIPF